MKKQFLILSVVFVFVCVLLFSCKKDEVSTPLTPATPGFKWKENAGAFITADSAYWTTWATGTGIRAYKGGMQNYFEINWPTQNNTSVGAKSLTANNADFTFLKGAESFDISSNQNLNITAFTNNKLSGSFNFTVSGGTTITSIQAEFTDLPQK